MVPGRPREQQAETAKVGDAAKMSPRAELRRPAVDITADVILMGGGI